MKRIEKEMREEFFSYCTSRGYLPKVALVSVQFTDEDQTEKELRTIDLSGNANMDNDDEIFFYVNGLEELIELTYNNSIGDFLIKEFKGYLN